MIAEHDFRTHGTLAVECPRCRLSHGAYLTVWRDGAPLPCRTYARDEHQHIVDHIPPAHPRAVGCGCGLHDAMRGAGSRDGAMPPRPVPGDRVLRLHIAGVLDIAIPPDVDDEDNARWEAWRDAAILAALDDVRWLDCTGVEDTETGVLNQNRWLRR
ncbi:MAG: hypothetical protein GEU80_17795 [Dehalococcoidia bacterium]|nr:hypothetical protein [Dehalococcoidia bacterium]